MPLGADYPQGRIEALVEAWADVQTEALMMSLMRSRLALTWLVGHRLDRARLAELALTEAMERVRAIDRVLHHPSCPARFTGELDDCTGCGS